MSRTRFTALATLAFLVAVLLPPSIGTVLAHLNPASAATAAHPRTSTTVTACPAPNTLWTGSYETAGEFDSTPWNNQPDAPRIVTSPVFEGSHAGAYTVPAGGSRSENVPSVREFVEGDTVTFDWHTYLEPGFPLATSEWQVLDQWKNDNDGSPPVELTVANGRFRVDGGWGNPTGPKLAGQDLGAATAGVWDHWVFTIRFSADPSLDSVDVWRNGAQLVTGWHMPGGTLYPGQNDYLKVGYYRSTAIPTTGTVVQDGWSITD